MSLFTIADLHLSFSSNKPMDVFSGWKNYTDKIKENWLYRVLPNDTVVIIGDVSWAMNFRELKKDFEFLNSLSGNKIIIKGNHDYWWTTVKKMNGFLEENNFSTIKILHNNAYVVDKKVVCGTRGWILDTTTASEDRKVYLRECIRLEASIKEGLKYNLPIYAFLHYPPISDNCEATELIQILNLYNIKKCFYGHLHGSSVNKAVIGARYGIEFELVSCDYVDFTPIII